MTCGGYKRRMRSWRKNDETSSSTTSNMPRLFRSPRQKNRGYRDRQAAGVGRLRRPVWNAILSALAGITMGRAGVAADSEPACSDDDFGSGGGVASLESCSGLYRDYVNFCR